MNLLIFQIKKNYGKKIIKIIYNHKIRIKKLKIMNQNQKQLKQMNIIIYFQWKV